MSSLSEKKLNFHLQRVDENQRPLMAGDATFPLKSASSQIGHKEFSSKIDSKISANQNEEIFRKNCVRS